MVKQFIETAYQGRHDCTNGLCKTSGQDANQLANGSTLLLMRSGKQDNL